MQNKKSTSKSSIYECYSEEEKQFTNLKEYKNYSRAFTSLKNSVDKGGFPFDPRFNAVHWAFDVADLINQIIYSYCLMNCYAESFKVKHKKGSLLSHVDFHVLFYADNCITRIYSCRDKLALMVWAYYSPFNPEKKKEVLTYSSILDRLKNPARCGLLINHHTKFLMYLENLKGSDFSFVEGYRHLKIHRREPSIEIYGVKPHHDWPYLIPILDKKDKRKFEDSLKKQYPNDKLREIVLKRCYINGVLFDQKKIIGRLYSYKDIKKNVYNCLIKLLKSGDGSFRVLKMKSPMKKI